MFKRFLKYNEDNLNDSSTISPDGLAFGHLDYELTVCEQTANHLDGVYERSSMHAEF